MAAHRVFLSSDDKGVVRQIATTPIRYLTYEDAARLARQAALLSSIDSPRIEDCDRGRLESALAAPAAGYGEYEHYRTLAEKAAALCYAVSKAHACPNGNKRLGCVLTLAFLVENGMSIWVNPTELTQKLEEVTGSQASAAESVRAELAKWIEARMMSALEVMVRIQAGRRPGEQL